MFVFLLGNYTLPFSMIELDRFTRNHTHRAPDGFAWTEPMTLKVCVPAVRPTQLRIANDNRKAA